MREHFLGNADFMYLGNKETRKLVYQRKEEVSPAHLCCLLLAGCEEVAGRKLLLEKVGFCFPVERNSLWPSV